MVVIINYEVGIILVSFKLPGVSNARDLRYPDAPYWPKN